MLLTKEIFEKACTLSSASVGGVHSSSSLIFSARVLLTNINNQKAKNETIMVLLKLGENLILPVAHLQSTSPNKNKSHYFICLFHNVSRNLDFFINASVLNAAKGKCFYYTQAY